MNIRPYLEHRPEIDESCYIDPACVVIGEVSLAEQVSVWPFAVIRGDVNSIRIGARSSSVPMTAILSSSPPLPTASAAQRVLSVEPS